MKTTLKESGSETTLEISDDSMDNDNFVEVTICEKDEENEEYTTVMVEVSELLRAITSFKK
jgi:hypothetical protein